MGDAGVKIPELLTRVKAMLNAFGPADAELSVGAMAEFAGVAPSTAYRIVGHLLELRILDQGAKAGRYRLGPKLLEWGFLAQRTLDVRRLALPSMEELLGATSETVQLAIRDGLEGVFVETLESPHRLRQHTMVGDRLPLHAGSSMRVLLAHAPEQIVIKCLARDRLRKLGPGTGTEPDELRRGLAEIREHGYALADSEVYAGSVAVSAPVFGASGQVVAALTVSGPASRWTSDKAREFVPRLKAAAAELSKRLGHPVGADQSLSSTEVP